MTTTTAPVSPHCVVHNPPLTPTTTPAPACPDDHDTQPLRIDAAAPAPVSTPFFFFFVIFYFFFFLFPSLAYDDVPSAPALAYQCQRATTGIYYIYIFDPFFLCNSVCWPQRPQPSVDDDEELPVTVATPTPSIDNDGLPHSRPPDDDNDDPKPPCIDASMPTSALFRFLYDSSITQTLSLAHDDDIWPPFASTANNVESDNEFNQPIYEVCRLD